MFERFTDRARRVVVRAQEQARLLNHDYIGTEHILLGLIAEGDGVAARALENLGISLEAVRARVEAIIGEGGATPEGHIPFTPRAKKVLELSLREALKLGHNYIGTEHILLGLTQEGMGVGAQVLKEMGVELAAVRHQVIQLLSGYRGGPPGVRTGIGPGVAPRHTPAAGKAGVEARRLAGSASVGTQHYLLALLAEEDTMAARALAGLGVTREAIEAKLADLDPAGTSDETPEEAGARRIRMRVEGRVLTLEIDDPQLASSLEQAMAGRKARIISGADPEAETAGFPNIWSAVSRSVEGLTRRRSFAGAVRDMPGPTAYWRPPALRERASAASYWIVNEPGGPKPYLEVGPDTGREQVRAWLLDWLRNRRPALIDEHVGIALWVAVDADADAGDGFTAQGFGFGHQGPPGSESVPLTVLVDAAIEDLSAVV